MRANVTHITRFFVRSTVLLWASWSSARAQLAPCYAGFEISSHCITTRGLDQKAAAYRRNITEAMTKLGASYQITLRLINNPVEAGYEASAGDVFTDVVRNEEMRNQSFIINVTTDFLERQPEILFEASSLHEVCHIMNDDLTGYHRNGANIEAAEEHCVLRAVGEPRYTEYLKAYAAYQHWDAPTYENVLQKVKDVVLVHAPRERDEADTLAAKYFSEHADGKEHLLVYNGELRDVSLVSTRDRVRHDPEKLSTLIRAGKPMIFFHNHPAGAGRAGMFPSQDDFGVAALFSSLVFRENPKLTVEFRVMQLDSERTVVSYGFKGTALEQIRNVAQEHQDAVARDLAQEGFTAYLQYACPVDLSRPDAEVCRTHPQYFIWPSDRFFVHYRPQ